MKTNEWIKIRAVKDDLYTFDGGPTQVRWVVLIGTEVSLPSGAKELRPAIDIASGPDKMTALLNASNKLRELARQMDRGVIP